MLLRHLSALVAARELARKDGASGSWEVCRWQDGNSPPPQERSLTCVTSVAVASTG